jgi:hypothetical protein
MKPERDIRITEDELAILIDLLDRFEKEFKKHAASCDKGYRSANSQHKKEQWLNKAHKCRALAEKLSEPFN